MGKLKAWFANDINCPQHEFSCRTVYPDNPCSSFAEWCDWLSSSRNGGYNPDSVLTDAFNRRLAEAKHVMKHDTDQYGLSYHIFEMESAMEKLLEYLKSQGL